MKLFSKTVLTLTATLVLLGGASNLTHATEAYQSVNEQGVYTLTAKQLAAQQMIDFISWSQNSAEHRALSFQSYHLAKQAFEAAKVPAGTTKIVISDLDETLLDNTPYEAALSLAGVDDNDDTWKEWEHVLSVRALPGAVDFAKYINTHGGRMFYVSNRFDVNKADCIKILKRLGFPNVSEDTVLLYSTTGNKDPRFEKVQTTPNSKVVLWLGDNLYDFPNAYSYRTQADRLAFVDDNKELWGTRFIVFPNAMYGSWMATLHHGKGSYYSLPISQQINLRLDSLRSWSGFNKATKE